MNLHPFPFRSLLWRAGTTFKAALSAKWSEMLVAALESVAVSSPEGGYISCDHLAGGTWINTTRPIPAYYLMRTPGGGLGAREGDGDNGEATCTFYEVKTVSGRRRVTLGTRTAKVWNDTASAVPADTDIKVHEQGGDLVYLGYVCPP